MLNNILKVTFLNNSISAYLFSALVFIVCILAIKILKYHILNYLKKWAEKTATKLDDFLIQTCEKTLIPLLYYGIICVL